MGAFKMNTWDIDQYFFNRKFLKVLGRLGLCTVPTLDAACDKLRIATYP